MRVEQTRRVMGGEDWKLWTELLINENLLAEGCMNLAYSYIGPEVTQPIYRNGTIGRAKRKISENTAGVLTDLMHKQCSGKAFVSVNKAVVTQASSAIPVVPLYVSLLFKVMREQGTHEGCIEQIIRLFNERLYTDKEVVPVDENGRIRVDDWEMDPIIQEKVIKAWGNITTENLFLKLPTSRNIRRNSLICLVSGLAMLTTLRKSIWLIPLIFTDHIKNRRTTLFYSELSFTIPFLFRDKISYG